MNQRIIRKGIIVSIFLALGIILAGFGIRMAISRDRDTCCSQQKEKDEPKSHADFYILEAISHQVLLNQ